jgi:predicted O-methyltransferase YrrM
MQGLRETIGLADRESVWTSPFKRFQMKLGAQFGTRPRVFDFLHWAGLVHPLSQTIQEEWNSITHYASCAATALEIGSYMGVTATKIAGVMAADGKLFCIDPYEPPYNSIYATASRHILRSGLVGKVNLLRCDMETANSKIPDVFDFAFVDGDRSYEGLRKNWEIVRGLLRPGAYAALHDTAFYSAHSTQCEGSIRYYHEIISRDAEFEHIECVASLNIIRRS